MCRLHCYCISSSRHVVYPQPHPDELFATWSGKSIFSKLDRRTCPEQFALDNVSQSLLTINTSRGLFRYLRLPYRVSSAPAIVQRAMEEILHGLDVSIYLDDILIASKYVYSHMVLLHEVLE